MEKKIQALQTELQRLVERENLDYTPNMSPMEQRALWDLRQNSSTFVTRSDKGVKLVVMTDRNGAPLS